MTKNKDACFSSVRPDWETPDELFAALHKFYNFTVDVAASEHNAKLERYYSVNTNGLCRNWGDERVWCNPPYGREISDWVDKALSATEDDPYSAEIVVMLVPARTDTKWFQKCISSGVIIAFIAGRLKFKGAASSAPFPSCLLIFKKDRRYKPGYMTYLNQNKGKYYLRISDPVKKNYCIVNL